MKTEEFRQFLNSEQKNTKKGNQPLTNNAINARVSRATRIEKELNVSLDDVSQCIDNLKDLKRTLKTSYPDNVSSSLYNTATRYYKFINGEDPEKKYKDFLKI